MVEASYKRKILKIIFRIILKIYFLITIIWFIINHLFFNLKYSSQLNPNFVIFGFIFLISLFLILPLFMILLAYYTRYKAQLEKKEKINISIHEKNVSVLMTISNFITPFLSPFVVCNIYGCFSLPAPIGEGITVALFTAMEFMYMRTYIHYKIDRISEREYKRDRSTYYFILILLILSYILVFI